MVFLMLKDQTHAIQFSCLFVNAQQVVPGRFAMFPPHKTIENSLSSTILMAIYPK
jgi:hypothetical protein